MTTKMRVAAAKKPRAKTKKRFRPEPWTAEDTADLDCIIERHEGARRNRIPEARRRLLVEHLSNWLARRIQEVRRTPAPGSHRRHLQDLAVMQRACDRLLACWQATEAKTWLWRACEPPRRGIANPALGVRHMIHSRTKNGLLYYDRELHAIIPADREECLIGVMHFFADDLRCLSLGIGRARSLLRGVRPNKAEVVGSLLVELYSAYLRDTGLKPSVRGPFQELAAYAVERVHGEVLGQRVLTDRLKLLHEIYAYYVVKSD